MALHTCLCSTQCVLLELLSPAIPPHPHLYCWGCCACRPPHLYCSCPHPTPVLLLPPPTPVWLGLLCLDDSGLCPLKDGRRGLTAEEGSPAMMSAAMRTVISAVISAVTSAAMSALMSAVISAVVSVLISAVVLRFAPVSSTPHPRPPLPHLLPPYLVAVAAAGCPVSRVVWGLLMKWYCCSRRRSHRRHPAALLAASDRSGSQTQAAVGVGGGARKVSKGTDFCKSATQHYVLRCSQAHRKTQDLRWPTLCGPPLPEA